MDTLGIFTGTGYIVTYATTGFYAQRSFEEFQGTIRADSIATATVDTLDGCKVFLYTTGIVVVSLVVFASLVAEVGSKIWKAP